MMVATTSPEALFASSPLHTENGTSPRRDVNEQDWIEASATAQTLRIKLERSLRAQADDASRRSSEEAEVERCLWMTSASAAQQVREKKDREMQARHDIEKAKMQDQIRELTPRVQSLQGECNSESQESRHQTIIECQNEEIGALTQRVSNLTEENRRCEQEQEQATAVMHTEMAAASQKVQRALENLECSSARMKETQTNGKLELEASRSNETLGLHDKEAMESMRSEAAAASLKVQRVSQNLEQCSARLQRVSELEKRVEVAEQMRVAALNSAATWLGVAKRRTRVTLGRKERKPSFDESRCCELLRQQQQEIRTLLDRVDNLKEEKRPTFDETQCCEMLCQQHQEIRALVNQVDVLKEENNSLPEQLRAASERKHDEAMELMRTEAATASRQVEMLSENVARCNARLDQTAELEAKLEAAMRMRAAAINSAISWRRVAQRESSALQAAERFQSTAMDAAVTCRPLLRCETQGVQALDDSGVAFGSPSFEGCSPKQESERGTQVPHEDSGVVKSTNAEVHSQSQAALLGTMVPHENGVVVPSPNVELQKPSTALQCEKKAAGDPIESSPRLCQKVLSSTQSQPILQVKAAQENGFVTDDHLVVDSPMQGVEKGASSVPTPHSGPNDVFCQPGWSMAQVANGIVAPEQTPRLKVHAPSQHAVQELPETPVSARRTLKSIPGRRLIVVRNRKADLKDTSFDWKIQRAKVTDFGNVHQRRPRRVEDTWSGIECPYDKVESSLSHLGPPPDDVPQEPPPQVSVQASVPSTPRRNSSHYRELPSRRTSL